MSRKRRTAPAKKEAESAAEKQREETPIDLNEDKPMNGDHFIISIALIIVVAVVAVIFSVMQGGEI